MASQVQQNQAQTGLQLPNLWQKALGRLDDELKAKLDFGNSKHDILKKVLRIAEQKKQLCLSKRWKFERNGEDIVLRDVVEKIIKWLHRFGTVGDIAMQFDPAHASLPWAGVRFLLQVGHFKVVCLLETDLFRLRYPKTRRLGRQLRAWRLCHV